jgi:uncharacterized protein with von Willebrand factor type A (vWA) domain
VQAALRAATPSTTSPRCGGSSASSRTGLPGRNGGALELTAKAIAGWADRALRDVSPTSTPAAGRPRRTTPAPRATTGATRVASATTQPLDVVRTVVNAVRRSGPGGLRLTVEDFEVVETERRNIGAVCLLVDLSYSMVLRDMWGAAKSTALALHALVTGQYPQDAVCRSSVSPRTPGCCADGARRARRRHGAGHQPAARADARGAVPRQAPRREPVVLVVTDGEPTAHLKPDGTSYFAWPPELETITATVAEGRPDDAPGCRAERLPPRRRSAARGLCRRRSRAATVARAAPRAPGASGSTS